MLFTGVTTMDPKTRFDSTVQCVGYDASDLSSVQRERLEAMLDCFDGETLLALKCFRNLDVTNDEDVPSGTVSVFSTGARVDHSAIPDSMFSVLAVSRIGNREDMPEGYDDAYFSSPDKRKAIGDAVPQYSPKPPKLSLRSKATGKEIDQWNGELGGPGSFAAVVSKLRENGRDKDYYCVSYGTAPVAVREFKDEIRRKEPTYSDLLYSDEWSGVMSYMQYLAKRNACKNVFSMADALGVPVRTTEMLSSYVKNAGHAYDTKADPEWLQHGASFGSTTWKGRPAAAIYNGVVPKHHCDALENAIFFVVSNPYDGITTFPITRPIRASGVPVNTGRTAPASEMDMSNAGIAKRAKGVVWEQPTEGKHHRDLHPEAFNPVAGDFKEAMKSAGGWNAENHTSVMVPLFVKLWNPELKRP